MKRDPFGPDFSWIRGYRLRSSDLKLKEHKRQHQLSRKKYDLKIARSFQPSLEFAIGVGIVVSFCVFARWSDAAVLRWYDGFFEEHEQYVRFFLEHRKNAQFAGNFVDIARPADPHHRGAYHIVREAKALFRRGHVLPHISASGVVDHSRYMPYSSYVLHLRRALVRVGVPVEEALKFAGQSARAGAATEAVQAGLPPHTLCRMAGVSTISWCLGYVRPDQEDRLRESRKIGL